MLNKLICPDCKRKLIRSKNLIKCIRCKRPFITFQGIPLLLPKLFSSFKFSEKQFYSKEFEKQQNVTFNYVEEDFEKDSCGLLRQFNGLEDKHAHILELGAGNGQYGLILKKRGFENVIITDISSTGLIAAKKYAKKHDLPYNDSFYAVDAENLPFEDDLFEIIYMTAALHHLENIPRAVSEIKRCLKPGGKAIIAVEPNKWFFKIVGPIANFLRIRRVQKEESSIADEQTQGFTMTELKNYFKNFEIVKEQKVWYLTGLIYYLPDLLKRLFNTKVDIPKQIKMQTLKLDSLIEKIPLINQFSFHITLIARKK